MNEYDNDYDSALCEYCGCILRYAFNRIRRHSQPEERKHKQGNIPICNSCIALLKARGELTIDPHREQKSIVNEEQIIKEQQEGFKYARLGRELETTLQSDKRVKDKDIDLFQNEDNLTD